MIIHQVAWRSGECIVKQARDLLPEDYLRDRLTVMLAGRVAAERVFLGSVSSGADEDIRMAAQLARWMVGRSTTPGRTASPPRTS